MKTRDHPAGLVAEHRYRVEVGFDAGLAWGRVRRTYQIEHRPGFLLQMGRELNDAALVIGMDRFVFGLIRKRTLVRWGLAPRSGD